MKKLKFLLKFIFFFFLLVIVYVALYLIIYLAITGISYVGEEVENAINGPQEEEVESTTDSQVDQQEFDRIHSELDQCQEKLDQIDIVCENSDGETEGLYSLVIDRDLYNIKSIAVKGQSEGIVGTLTFDEDRFVSANQALDLSENYNRVIFSIGYIGTGCDSSNDTECIEWLDEADNDAKEIGGIWEFNLKTKEFKHIVKSPSGAWIEEMINNTPLLVFSGSYNGKEGMCAVDVETYEVQYLYNNQVVEVDTTLAE